jgi:hypothetical protein
MSFSKANISSLIMGMFYSFCKGMKNSGYETTMAIITFYFVRKMMVGATNEFVVNPYVPHYWQKI